MNNVKNIPKLRFPNFVGTWQEMKLSELVNNFGGTALEEFAGTTGRHKFISIGNYSKDGVYLDNNQRILLNDKTRLKLLGKNDLVMVLNDKTSAGDLIGSTILIDQDDVYIYNQRSERLVPVSSVSAKYLWYFLNSSKFRRLIFSISQGGTQIYVNFPQVKKLNMFMPKKVEQQKIADFLTAVDDKITAIDKKVELLKKYKKGVMKKIFTQQIRFKNDDGDDYPRWGKKNLRDIVAIKTGKKDVNQGNPNGQYPFFTCAREHTYSDEYSFEGEAVMIAGNGEVGLCTYYNGKFEAYQRTYVLQDFGLSIDYVFLYLKDAFQAFAESQKQQGSMPYIKLSTLRDFIVPIQDKGEQNKITELLTLIDGKIKAEEGKLAVAKKFKSALLQGMFV